MGHIDKSFNSWINEYPESFHPMDLKRFYCFVKNVCRYSRKNKDRVWLMDKIDKCPHKMSEEDTEAYCDKFEELQNFYRTPCNY